MSNQIENKERVYGEKIKISGLCCANCARELEEELNKESGVSAVVDFVNMRVVLDAENAEARERAIHTITHFEDVKIVTGEEKRKSIFKEHLKDIICIIIAVVFFVPVFVIDLMGLTESSLTLRILSYVFFTVAFMAVGHPVLINTAKNVVKGRLFDENFLMTIASLGAIALGI